MSWIFCRNTSFVSNLLYSLSCFGILKTSVLNLFIYLFYFTGPLTSLFMTTEPPINVNESRPVSLLTVKDGDSVSVWCVSRGGCPSPEMTIHLGDTDVAYVFQRTRQSVEMTGERGFRLLQCTSTRWTTTLKLREYHDGKSLRCKVNSGPNHKEANWTDMQLYVQCKMMNIFTCEWICIWTRH